MRFIATALTLAAMVASLPTDQNKKEDDEPKTIVLAEAKECQFDMSQTLESLKDKELRDGGLSVVDEAAKKFFEETIKKHRYDKIVEHGPKTRREQERAILQNQINLNTQRVEDLKNGTWRKLKIELLEHEIHLLVADRNGYKYKYNQA